MSDFLRNFEFGSRTSTCTHRKVHTVRRPSVNLVKFLNKLSYAATVAVAVPERIIDSSQFALCLSFLAPEDAITTDVSVMQASEQKHEMDWIKMSFWHVRCEDGDDSCQLLLWVTCKNILQWKKLTGSSELGRGNQISSQMTSVNE